VKEHGCLGCRERQDSSTLQHWTPHTAPSLSCIAALHIARKPYGLVSPEENGMRMMSAVIISAGADALHYLNGV